MYRCVDCDCIFEEPIIQKFSYEEFYGVASMFDTSTPLEIKVCPNCNSDVLEIIENNGDDEDDE